MRARYGAPRPGRRRLQIAAIVALAAVALGWLVWAMLFHAAPKAASELVTWDVVDEHQVMVRIEVELKDGVAARCRVRAIAEDHSTVGETSFVPVDGTNELTFRTERRATSVESLGCTAPGQPRPR